MTFIPFLPPGITKAYADTLYAALSHTHAADAIVSGVLDNARVNWASPSAIGGTTPAAGAFTNIAASGSAPFTATLNGQVFDLYHFYSPASVGNVFYWRFTSSADFRADFGANSKTGSLGIGLISSTSPSVFLADLGLSLTNAAKSTSLVIGATGANDVIQFTTPDLMEWKISAGTGITKRWSSTLGLELADAYSNQVFLANAAGVTIRARDTTTNAVSNAVVAGHNLSSGTAATGFGVGVAFKLDSSTTANRDAALISAAWTTATDASRASSLTLSTYSVASKVDVLTLYPDSITAGTSNINFVANRWDASGWIRIGNTSNLRIRGDGDLKIETVAAVGIYLTTNSVVRLTVSSAGLFTFWDGADFALGTTTGTKIGTATTQKLAFWNATPVVQPTFIADPSGGGTQDAEARTAINAILDLLAATGLMAAS